jgi:hypothetical protein
MTRGGVVVTVGGDAAAVERRLVGGRLVCPGCSGVLAGWGYARERSVRGVDGSARLRPRRARCAGWAQRPESLWGQTRLFNHVQGHNARGPAIAGPRPSGG